MSSSAKLSWPFESWSSHLWRRFWSIECVFAGWNMSLCLDLAELPHAVRTRDPVVKLSSSLCHLLLNLVYPSFSLRSFLSWSCLISSFHCSCHLYRLLELLVLGTPLRVLLLLIFLASLFRWKSFLHQWLGCKFQANFRLAWTRGFMTKKFSLVHRCLAVPAWPSNFFYLTTDASLLHLVSHSKAILLLFVDCLLFLFTKFALGLCSTFNLEVYISPRHLIFLAIFVCCRWSKFGLELSFLLLFLLSISWVLHRHCLNMFLGFLFLITKHIIVCHFPFMPENQWFARFAWLLVDLKGSR